VKAYELFGFDNVVGRLFGLEVEAEGVNLPRAPLGWDQVDDGSLRGVFPDSRSEYVTKGAVTKDDAVALLQALYTEADKSQTIWDFSFRTSFHVHINILDLEEEQVLNIIYAYRLLESALFTKCGAVRKNNRFCLRAADSDSFIDVSDMAFRRGLKEAAMFAHGEDMRYSSLNLASLRKHGTLELRCKDASSSVENMIDWVETIDKLVNWAVSFKNPLEMFHAVQQVRIPLPEVVLDIETQDKEYAKDISLSLQIPFLYSQYVEAQEVKKVRPKAGLGDNQARLRALLDDMDRLQPAIQVDDIRDVFAFEQVRGA